MTKAKTTQNTRITLVVTLARDYQYEYINPHRYYPETKYIYTFEDENGNVYVWKTGCFIGYDIIDDNGYCEFVHVNRGDKIEITATVKELSEYKGKPQIILNRVKVNSIIERALTYEEKMEIKRKEQLASLKDGDMLWEKMPYKQYKEHYSDCETLAGSFDKDDHTGATITVIIREGRLKGSGVRGKCFRTYKVTHKNGKWSTYRAVSEENALKQARKAFPNETFTLDSVETYVCDNIINNMLKFAL